MDARLFVIGVIGFIIVVTVGFEMYGRVKLRQRVRTQWGHLPYGSVFDHEESLKRAYEDAKAYNKKASVVDDITWYDLNLFQVYQQINHTYSSIGSQALYQRLRSFDFDEKNQQEMEQLMAFLEKNPKLRENLEYSFAKLGKKDNNFVVQYLANGKAKKLSHLWLFIILGLLPIASLAAFLAGFKLGIFILLLSIVGNTIYYMRKKIELEVELSSMSYLVQMISAANRISKLALPWQEELKRLVKPLQGVLKFAFSFRVKTGSEGEIFFEYVNIMFMLPFISYHFVLERLEKYNQESIRLWELLGELEVACAILNYRTLLPLWCKPEFRDGGVAAEDIYHPLVANAVVNPVDWQQNTLVTGSNASGKSTYVKSVAINCILAQTIYTVLAEKFAMQHGHVLTSMAVEDNVLEGDSYFVAEIKSIKRALDVVKTGERCYCFVDEILKGTNTIERVAASSSVVNWLSEYPSIAFVATHDIELTEILKNSCGNVHFEEQVTEEQGVEFDYQLRQGPSTSRNAIRLLKVMAYPQDIVDKAKKEAENFDEHRQWAVYE